MREEIERKKESEYMSVLGACLVRKMREKERVNASYVF